jgi:hypothetical protein
VNRNLKIAIVLSGKTQRELSFDTRIAETRISDLVRGRGWPSSTEREALATVLGADPFAYFEVAAPEGPRR